VSHMLVVPPMAKKKARDDQAVKVDRHLVVKAQLIAKTRGVTVAEYLSELLRPHIEKDFPKALGTLDQREP
jgi:hypothetical protein